MKGAENAAAILRRGAPRVAKTHAQPPSPLALLDAVKAAVDLPFDKGLKVEIDQSRQLQQATEARALRHLFFAEREVRKIPGISHEMKPRAVRRVGIVGAGTMGGGIAMCFANAGMPVTILDADAGESGPRPGHHPQELRAFGVDAAA